MALRSVPIDEHEKKYSFTRNYPRIKRNSETRKHHNEIVTLVKAGFNVADICRELRKDGYTRDPSTLRWYILRYVDAPLVRYYGNQYTQSGTCKQGHKWNSNNTVYYYYENKPVRRCRICINANSRARYAARRRLKDGTGKER